MAAVEPHLYVEEGFRAASKQPDSIDAWGLVVRALNLTSKLDRPQNDEAQTLLRRAIEMEPGYARAHALLGLTEWWAAWCFWSSGQAHDLPPDIGARATRRCRSTPRTRGHG